MERKYRNGLCMRGHEFRVVGTRVSSSGKVVDKKQCDICKRATRFARLCGLEVDAVLKHMPGDSCEICGKETKKLCLDHNHETGEIRGWLCNGCNSGLGHFGDSPKTITRALRYLMERGHYGSPEVSST